jgi:hypothetical protein
MQNLLLPLSLLLTISLNAQDYITYRTFGPFAPNLNRGCEGRLNIGGRVQAITVDPSNANNLVISNQFGGLWRSFTGGNAWEWCEELPEIFTADVAFGRDRKLFATVYQNGMTNNGGGVYISSNSGGVWRRAMTAMPPAAAGERLSAYGIAVAPGNPDVVFIGTDKGVSITNDGGGTWRYRSVRGTEAHKVFNVLAFTPETVIAGADDAAYLSTDGGDTWTSIINEPFTWSFNRFDNHPTLRNKVFMIGDWGNLYCYDVLTRTFFTIQHPGMGSRWPFVRVSAPVGSPDAYVVWLSTGVCLTKATAASETALRALNNSTSWSVICGSNLHDDMGDLAFNNTKTLPLYAGSDGGIFKAEDATGNTWITGADAISGMNSLQITGLTGTQVSTGDPRDPYQYDLYFTTQDNNNHGSGDNGLTWPFCDCTEGHSIKSIQSVSTAADARVVYQNISCTGGNKIAQRNFGSSVVITTTNDSPDPIAQWGTATPLTGTTYFGTAVLGSGNLGFFISNAANANSWRLTATSNGMNLMGYLAQQTRLAGRTAVYLPVNIVFDYNACTPSTKTGLLRISNVMASGVTSYTAADRIMLPDNGSLGQLATEFDWHAVYGVHPEDGNFIIAPDVCNGRIMVTRTGGARWDPDTRLLDLVTNSGEYQLYGDQARMQVTCISFDPYNNDHILIGTRDVGIIESYDRGATWYNVFNTNKIKYITGFFFEHDGTIVVSTYGLGLWKSYLARIPFPVFVDDCLLNGTCIFIDPHHYKRRIIFPKDIVNVPGVLVYNGEILNGGDLAKGSRTIIISNGAVAKFYNMTEKESSRYTVKYAPLNLKMKAQQKLVGMTWNKDSAGLFMQHNKNLDLRDEFKASAKNMLLANYDFTQEKMQKKGAYIQPKQTPFFLIRGSVNDIVNPIVTGKEFEVELFNVKDSLQSLEIKIDGRVVKDIKQLPNKNPNQRGLYFKVYLTNFRDIKEGAHIVTVKLANGSLLSRHFLYSYKDEGEKNQ